MEEAKKFMEDHDLIDSPIEVGEKSSRASSITLFIWCQLGWVGTVVFSGILYQTTDKGFDFIYGLVGIVMTLVMTGAFVFTSGTLTTPKEILEENKILRDKLNVSRAALNKISELRYKEAELNNTNAEQEIEVQIAKGALHLTESTWN